MALPHQWGVAVMRIIIGALVGAIPGGTMVLLTIPVSGEMKLTLGTGGILLMVIGTVVGAIVGARKR